MEDLELIMEPYLVENFIEDNEKLIEERAKEIDEIEVQVLEINEIMQDLCTIIKEQGDHLEVVEQQVEKTVVNTEQAVEELQLANEYSKSMRNKMFKIVGYTTLGFCLGGGIGSIHGLTTAALGSGIGTGAGALWGSISGIFS